MWDETKFHDAIEETELQIAGLTERFGDENIYKQPEEFARLQQQMAEKKDYLELLYRAYEHKHN
ncbi:MAG: hypothetical protein JW804_00805 [Sedimentisphaerales bacterium]|nr:hypothetical protein [Sedimentisphaerales bacterium]